MTWFTFFIHSHPWETVVSAAWRKYPNPMNPAVVGIDVIDRRLEGGILKTHRLITTEWGFPSWASRLLGSDQACFASEHSAVNTETKTMTLMSRNVSLSREQVMMSY